MFGNKKHRPDSDGQINYASLVSSMEKGKELFEELKRKSHPDRFIGTGKEEIATNLFQEVLSHSTDYDRLLELKLSIQEDLGV